MCTQIHSHVIWHVFVFLGAYAQFEVCKVAFELRHTLLAACSA